MPTALPPIHAMPTAQIYCHICGSIQPLVVDDPQPGDRGPFDNATDLVCGTCQFVITTAYTLNPRRKGPDRPRAIDLRAGNDAEDDAAETDAGTPRWTDSEVRRRCA